MSFTKITAGNRHRHYDKIVAKAANMELFVFERQHTATHDKELFKELAPDGNKAIWFHESCDYFLCLPQRKEACLHWLNGGESQYLSNGMKKWINFGNSTRWSDTHLFMTTECEVRIKPKKEKRWIAVRKSDHYVESITYLSEESAEEDSPSDYWTHHEIEVEV